LLIPPGGDLVAGKFEQSASDLGVPLLCLDVTISPGCLSGELARTDAKDIKLQPLETQHNACVLVRPDHFIAWVEQPHLRVGRKMQ